MAVISRLDRLHRRSSVHTLCTPKHTKIFNTNLVIPPSSRFTRMYRGTRNRGTGEQGNHYFWSPVACCLITLWKCQNSSCSVKGPLDMEDPTRTTSQKMTKKKKMMMMKKKKERIEIGCSSTKCVGGAE